MTQYLLAEYSRDVKWLGSLDQATSSFALWSSFDAHMGQNGHDDLSAAMQPHVQQNTMYCLCEHLFK